MTKTTVYEVEGKKYALIGEKLVPIEDSTQTKKQEKKSSVKTHARSDIPNIIKSMSKKDLIDTFGDMTLNPKETPYTCAVEPFFKEYNILLRERKDGSTEKPFISRAIRHQIIIAQLNGESKTRFNTVKTNCMKFLQEKINAIPKDTTVIPMQKRREFNLQELQRWENETFTGKARPTGKKVPDEED